MSDLPKLRVGLLGIGLAAYWTQFDGLEERLKGYLDTVAERLYDPTREVINFGLVDSAERASIVGHETRVQDIDFLVIYVTTYALSAIVLPIVRKAKVPVLVLNLQPTAALDYARFNDLQDRTTMTGEWLAYCSACTMPEIANVFERCEIPFHQVNGRLDDDPECWREIHEWMDAAQVMHGLSHLRLGLMGHYYSGMLDIATDLTAVSYIFGTHFEQLEVDELSSIRLNVSDTEVRQEVEVLRDAFDIQEDCSFFELDRAARTSVALEQFIKKYSLGALAYYYKGSGSELNEDTMSSIILGTSLLTRRGIPVAGEYEIKNALAMKIMDSFGTGGSFTEYYAVDYTDDIVLMGHDGPGHPGIADGKTRVRPLDVYHGKVGRGLSVEMSVKAGPVTLLSVVENKRRGFKLLVAECSIEAGPILEIGNTNSRYRFPIGARKFIQRWNEHGPAHHCAVGVGHIAHKLEKLGALLNVDVVQVC
ncbi:L-arabinose isomerase [Edaphobacter aggregans]|uniref:L-arabinose isomerase n=1 Tax=Edaphobacter aggregans TaxID=570835 RepID=A0A428MDQ6_9BACT|nr:L-arabinose isomerase [Edaphobacter aggregans]